MGLFGGGNSAQQSSVANTTSSVVNDDRIGVADNAVALMATNGGSLVQSITNNSVNQVVSEPQLVAVSQAITGTLDTVSDTVADLVSGIGETHSTVAYIGDAALKTSIDLFQRASGLADAGIAAAERAANDAIANAQANLRDSLDAVTGSHKDSLNAVISSQAEAFDFARVVQGDLKDAYGDFSSLLANESDANRDYSTQLVGSVLQQARTSDERNIEKFMTTATWIVALVVAAFVIPKIGTAK